MIPLNEMPFTWAQFSAVVEELRLVTSERDMLAQQVVQMYDYRSELLSQIKALKSEARADVEKSTSDVWTRLEEVLLDFGGPNKITAIKEYRRIFDSGLREAKDAIEDHFYTEGDTHLLKPEYVQALEKAKAKRAAEHQEKIC